METILEGACVAAFIMALVGCGGGTSAVPRATATERIGVYDSRAVAVAFVGTEAFNKWRSELKAEHQKAKAAGNQKRAAELEAEAVKRQKLTHKQVFSTAPVDDILALIKDSLPAIKQKAGVDLLVSKWDTDELAKHPSAEHIDVTMGLVDALKPDEQQRKRAIEIQKQKPMPLNQAEQIED